MAMVDLLLSGAMSQIPPLIVEKFLKRDMMSSGPTHKSFLDARNLCMQAAFRHLYKSVYAVHTIAKRHDDAVFDAMQLVQVERGI